MEKIKSGREIVADFIDLLKEDASLDPDIVSSITTLYKEGKLSDTTITNALEKLRKRITDETSEINS